jgi:carboxypeptidase Taq
MEKENDLYFKYIKYKNKYYLLKKKIVIEKYTKLCDKLYEIGRLNGVFNLLGWDERTIMPAEGAEARGKQKAVLSQVIYERSTSLELKKLINWLNLPEHLNLLPTDFDKANVREADYNYKLISPITPKLINQIEQLQTKAYVLWVEAKNTNSFIKFENILSQLVQMEKIKSQLVWEKLNPYDGSIINFERGYNQNNIENIFNSIKQKIIILLDQVTNSSEYKNYTIPNELLGGEVWSIEKQKELVNLVTRQIGFNFNKGRIDLSVHPFTSSNSINDTRITLRYSTKNWTEGLKILMHEFGHGLYEQQLPAKYEFLPVCKFITMGVHESQSLLWEKYIFKSESFWKWLTPHIHKIFPHTNKMQPNDFYRFVNKIEPGFIRVDADELCYPLHVILRFEIEKDLINGIINVNSIPTIWNEKVKTYLNLNVPDDCVGCLQDVHWSQMSFGYFPSYLLGNMMATQLWYQLQKEIPCLDDEIATGNFQLISNWLKEKIHMQGKLFNTMDLILEFATGSKLNPEIFVQYLSEKFNKIYKL